MVRPAGLAVLVWLVAAPALALTVTSFAIDGTVRCTGGACAAFGLGAGAVSWGEWLELNGLEPVDPDFGYLFSHVLVAREPENGPIASFITLAGRPVPEPSTFALVAAALALGLRRFA